LPARRALRPSLSRNNAGAKLALTGPRQFERAERINQRAEQIQDKSAQIVAGARKVFVIVLPVLLALLIYVSWLILRR
jgi:3'-phosphoadenosine 5'-phosphosulfate sulfotransferase (PAPS reductase)/FAD synthetase